MSNGILYLIRGLPGSGKTTLAYALKPGACVSADDFMVDEEGMYSYDPSRLKECHELCQNAVQLAMKVGRPTIAVHNTFTQNWEMKPYKLLAKEEGYSVFVIRCENNFGNTHEVPEYRIEIMRDRFEKNNDIY